MKILCPKCSTRVQQENVNISTDLAYCHNCDESFSISMLHNQNESSFDVGHPPGGVRYEEGVSGKVITASTRSLAVLFMIPFMVIWSGGSLGILYGSQIVSGEFSLGFSLFGLPFLIGSIWLLSNIVMRICGVVRISVLGNECTIFTGVGTIGIYKEVDLDTVDVVAEGYTLNNKHYRSRAIFLDGRGTVRFGTLLNDEKRYYIVKALQQMLHKRGS